MILKIINFRTFLYDIIPPQTPGSKKVSFKLIRQIVDYPDQLEPESYGTFHLGNMNFPFFSPCFSRYMKVDQGTGEFIIKDAIKDTVVAIVPRDFICFNKLLYKDIRECLYRMKWIDYSTLLILSKEGVEKLIDIDNNFDEIGYNHRPFFDESEEAIVS
jgi:hypothetical protein